ncbi:hypothetical protein KIPB_011818 [Kipferlia bialata]|uniref:Uncharacterized protein n=1 Tax=Kipferlia bialata TaxID=797122 RepID=A0A391NUV2_9EUKA|nr:hypothetical protein KIPB_011818 [Kipferlia bialata]|eukprot:g11818.t1
MRAQFASLNIMVIRSLNRNLRHDDPIVAVPLANGNEVPDFPKTLGRVFCMDVQELHKLLVRCEVAVPQFEPGAEEAEMKRELIISFCRHIGERP